MTTESKLQTLRNLCSARRELLYGTMPDAIPNLTDEERRAFARLYVIERVIEAAVAAAEKAVIWDDPEPFNPEHARLAAELARVEAKSDAAQVLVNLIGFDAEMTKAVREGTNQRELTSATFSLREQINRYTHRGTKYGRARIIALDDYHARVAEVKAATRRDLDAQYAAEVAQLNGIVRTANFRHKQAVRDIEQKIRWLVFGTDLVGSDAAITALHAEALSEKARE